MMDPFRVASFLAQQWILLPLLMLALAFALLWITPLVAQAAFMREFRRRPVRKIGPERLGMKLLDAVSSHQQQKTEGGGEAERHAA